LRPGLIATEARQRLATLPAYEALPAGALDSLAASAGELRFAAGATVVREGDPADAFFVILAGRAGVVGRGAAGPVPFASLGPGEAFGDVGLLDGTGRRSASVVADTELRLARLSADALRQALARDPEARARLERVAERQRIADFIKLATPFAALDAGARRRLADQVSVRRVSAGEVVIEQGAPGDACYLVRSGSIEIRVASEGRPARAVATIREGTLLGEVAVLTDAPRNASAVAVEPCELLELRRADLLDALAQSRELEASLFDLVERRDRPRRVEGIEVHARTTVEGDAVAVLKDPRRGAYFQLSAGGLFLWNRLSGDVTLDELTLAWFAEFGTFAPHLVQDMLRALVRAGFARTARRPAGSARGVLATLAGLLELRWTFDGLDAVFTRAHAATGGLLRSRAALVVAAVASAAGLAAFAADAPRYWRLAFASASAATLAIVYGAVVLSTLVHELGHGVALKAFGRQVPRAGIGLYYFAPIVFVDTSDAWLEPRSRRLVVSLAGTATDVALAGAASLLAVALDDGPAVTALAAFAAISYVSVLANLNPLLRLDGYHALVDLLGRPGLRAHALAWAGRRLPRALRDPAELRAHKVDLAYALGSLAYLAALAAAVVVAARGAVAGLGLPAPVSTGLPWAIGALAALALAAGAVRDLQGDAAG
jgi:CRP-like cAMP-binding protein